MHALALLAVVCRIALPRHDKNIPNTNMRNTRSCHNTLRPNKANIQRIPATSQELTFCRKCRIPPADSRTLPSATIDANLKRMLLLKESRCDLPGKGDIPLATLITLDNLIIQRRREFELRLRIEPECCFTCHVTFLFRKCITWPAATHKGIRLPCRPVWMLQRKRVPKLMRQRSAERSLRKRPSLNNLAPNRSLSTLARLVCPLPNKSNLPLWNRNSL